MGNSSIAGLTAGAVTAQAQRTIVTLTSPDTDRSDGSASQTGSASDSVEISEQGRSYLQRVNELLAHLEEFVDAIAEAYQSEGEISENAAEIQALFEGVDTGGPAIGGAQVSNVQLQFAFASVTVEVEVQQADPVVLDLDGDGIELTDVENGARFDITGIGRAVQTAFVTGGDAFLALDRDSNGSIDSGLELFGDQRGASNGFDELRRLDSNGDARIDANDAQFNQLLLLSGSGAIRSLAQAGVASIELAYLNTDQAAAGGNRIAQISSFTRTDGSTGIAADALLNYRA